MGHRNNTLCPSFVITPRVLKCRRSILSGVAGYIVSPYTVATCITVPGICRDDQHLSIVLSPMFALLLAFVVAAPGVLADDILYTLPNAHATV